MQILTESSDEEPAVSVEAAPNHVSNWSSDNVFVLQQPVKGTRSTLSSDASPRDRGGSTSPIRIQAIDPRDVRPVGGLECGSCSTVGSPISGKGSPQTRRPRPMLVEICDSETGSFQSLIRGRAPARGKGQ
jgi:hypothetical protein